MKPEKLYEIVKDMKAIDFFRSIEHKLGVIKPDAGINHPVGSIRQTINIMLARYEKNYLPKDETIKEFMKRDKTHCRNLIEYISNAMDKYHLQI